MLSLSAGTGNKAGKHVFGDAPPTGFARSLMKNKIFESFDKAIDDIFDGAVIGHSIFGTASQALNLWEALSRKQVKDLTIVTNMSHPRQAAPQGPSLPTFGPIDCILQPGKVKRLITGFSSNVYSTMVGHVAEFEEATMNMDVIPYGSLCTRLEAAACGYGGILTPVGVGSFLEDYCEKMVVDGKEFLLEKPLQLDFGFVKAWKADKLGNLVYHRMQRTQNPLIARASKVTIAEVLEVVEPGEIDPDQIHTPHIYVDRVVRVPRGGMGSFEWNEVVRVLGYGPGGTRRKAAEEGRGN
jgi:3-oxoacid CoA-transferase subunit A